MAKFIVVGERIHCISPSIKRRLPSATGAISRARKAQIEAGADYRTSTSTGRRRRKTFRNGVTTIWESRDDIPLALDTAKAIEAGLSAQPQEGQTGH